MVGWYHQLDGHEFEQTPGIGGHKSLVCCCPWGSQRLKHDWATELNLPWFMDLTFQVPMQYYSLQHQTLVSPSYTTTAWHFFCFGSASSFLLKLFLHSSPVAWWTATNLGGSYFSVISFCLFIQFMGFSRQEYWSGLLFAFPVDCIYSELSTMTHPSWVDLHGIAHILLS